MKPTPEQRTAIETHDRALIVEAGAGTGKTWVLVRRFMHLLERHPEWPLESIVAVTFTEKAAREMRTRLRRAVEQTAKERPAHRHWQDRRLNLDRLQVGTIHSLCARILRENAIAAEIDPRFQVLDVQESDLLKEQAVQETVKALDAEDHAALALLASLRTSDLYVEMVSMLNKRATLQRLFKDLDYPDALLARWKTGLVEMRADLWQAQLLENPDLMDVCKEIQDIPIVDQQDKLAAAVQAAQDGAHAAAEGDLVRAVDRWWTIKRVGGAAANWGGKDGKDHISKDLLKPLQEAAKTLVKKGFLREIGPSDEDAAHHLNLWRVLWGRLEENYNQIKGSQQALDFDDLEMFTERLLHKTPRVPRLQRFINGSNHLMVDEFQDTNDAQQHIVYALAPIEDPGRLFVVGDAKQSIYRFRQAQVSIFSRTSADIQSVTGKAPEKLSTSFRTHHSLVQASNQLFDHLLQPLGAVRADFEAAPGPLCAQRQAHPNLPAPVELLLLPDKDPQGTNIGVGDGRVWEAQWIARRLLDLKDDRFPVWDKERQTYRDFNFGDAAVLFRATTSLPLYESELKNYGLPYLTVSGRGYYDRQEVQDLIALLSVLANPLDDLNLAAVLRSPLFSLNDETLYRLRRHTAEGEFAAAPIHLRTALSQPPFTSQPGLVARAQKILEDLWALAGRVDVWALLREALEITAYETALAMNDGETGRQRANVNKFLSLARERGAAGISGFLSRVRDLEAREAREGEAPGREPQGGAVQLMSIHASKGLEFPVVIVADIGRRKGGGFGSSYLLHDPAFGLLCKVRDEKGNWQKPAGYAWGQWLHERMEEAERKRLLYVACTRAADLLILSGQLGNKDAWLGEVCEALGVEAQGPEMEEQPCSDYAVRVYRPQAPEESPAAVSQPVAGAVPDMPTLPPLAQPLPPKQRPLAAAVTHLEQLFSLDLDEQADIQPAIRVNERVETNKRAPGYQVGNIVHLALAHWECLDYPVDRLTRLLENYGRRKGVFQSALVDAVRRSYRMLKNLKNHSVYVDIRQARMRYHEVPLSMAASVGSLHGVTDLLYQDQNGDWRLLDWKTEWSPIADVEENASRHVTQMAVYAQAARQRLGVLPQVELCFLCPEVHLYRIPGEAIANALEGLV